MAEELCEEADGIFATLIVSAAIRVQEATTAVPPNLPPRKACHQHPIQRSGLVKTQPSHERAESLIQQARLLFLRGQHQQAARLCRTALQLTPEDAAALELLGDLLHRQRDWEGALTHYRRALVAGPARPGLADKYDQVLNSDRRPGWQKLADGLAEGLARSAEHKLQQAAMAPLHILLGLGLLALLVWLAQHLP